MAEKKEQDKPKKTPKKTSWRELWERDRERYSFTRSRYSEEFLNKKIEIIDVDRPEYKDK